MHRSPEGRNTENFDSAFHDLAPPNPFIRRQIMNFNPVILPLIMSLITAKLPATPVTETHDIVIFGGTSAGIAAGIQAKREGRSIIVLEPSPHVGGLTTGGLGQTDIGNKQVIGGISREFYQRIRAYYREPENWNWQGPETYADDGQTRTDPNEDAKWTFEPSAAQRVLAEMVADAGLEVRTGQRLRRDGSGVLKDGATLREIVMEDGSRYRAKVFIDATYEGDLLAEAGVTFHVGRESNSDHDETLNGAQPGDWAPSLRGAATVTATDIAGMTSPRSALFQDGLIAMNAHNHQLKSGIDPYVVPGDPQSGLLPGIDPEPMAALGTGDHRTQAYNYRVTLTDHPGNRLPIEKPTDYDPLAYEILLRHFAAHGPEDRPNVFINSPMPNRKTDTNNGGGFSTDLIGKNWDWAEASYEQREVLAARLRDYTLGFFWTLQNHPDIRQDFREWIGVWGLPKDEYVDTGHFSPQVYVREGRRMIGEIVLTQHHCERLLAEPDVIGMAAYGMDSHHVRRYVTAEGFVRNEGNVQGHVKAPYGVSYRALLPKREQAGNLIVPVALSATHIAFGSIRMEPVFMILGQSAATAAGLALDNQSSLHEVSYPALRERLLEAGQILQAHPDRPRALPHR